MRILHVIPSIDLSLGGPSRTSVHLANSLSAHHEVCVHFYTHDAPDNNRLELFSGVISHFQNNSGGFFSKLMLADRRRLKVLLGDYKFNLIHIHGAFHPLCHWAATQARSKNIPYIIQPRGMLEPWAIKNRYFKKKVALCVYQKSDLKFAAGFIATSEQEVNSIKALGVSGSIVLIPNGVEIPLSIDGLGKIRKERRVALFLSRIHPKKGIYELVSAWSSLRPKGWELRIVGPDDGGHIEKIKLELEAKNLSSLVSVVGPRYGLDRTHEFVNADLFVLPTYSENFGVAIAEALSYGVPVLTTTGAPWSSLIDNDCGWWIAPGEESLLNALPGVLKWCDQDNLERSNRARLLAAKYDWESVALQTKNFYLEVIRKNFN